MNPNRVHAVTKINPHYKKEKKRRKKPRGLEVCKNTKERSRTEQGQGCGFGWHPLQLSSSSSSAHHQNKRPNYELTSKIPVQFRPKSIKSINEERGPTSYPEFLQKSLNSRPPCVAKKGANTRDSTAISLMRMFNDGPEVSFKGSPIVSPITAALCGSDPLGPKLTA